MSVVPSGPFAQPLHDLRSLMVASAAWQSWCGDAAQAAADSYLVACPANLRRPHTIIDTAPDFSRSRDGVTIGPFVQNGGLMLYVCAPVVTGGTDNDATTDFLNRLGAVMLDLEAAPGNGGRGLVINGYSIVAGPQRMPAEVRDKNGDVVEIQLRLDATVWP